MATNMQNKLEYSNLLYCNTIAYNQKVLCIAREVEFKCFHKSSVYGHPEFILTQNDYIELIVLSFLAFIT